MKRCSVLLFNPKGFGVEAMRPLNPGLLIHLAPKQMHSQVASPVANLPFDDSVLVSPELVSAHNLKIPEIMKGRPGRISKNKSTMKHWCYWIMSKVSAYRWLRRQEQGLQAKSNMSAAMEQHGISYSEWSSKAAPHCVNAMRPKTLTDLARVEPLAFRCYAEVIRSDNMLAYDKYPHYRKERIAAAVKARSWYNTYAMRSPLPTKRRLPDPNWREIPYEHGKHFDATFHAQHPIFLVDWKI
eukprot:TRINITY_DN8376_c0_g2_i1.p1 TRINITY_DN8376_c0_g2~~TRINITY_DN8376_c0_g2_i1.p1  ORF type:complete len:241 (+),score=29.78 TRINITY_DN8376_c0_g2_i1:62-784(+)